MNTVNDLNSRFWSVIEPVTVPQSIQDIHSAKRAKIEQDKMAVRCRMDKEKEKLRDLNRHLREAIADYRAYSHFYMLRRVPKYLWLKFVELWYQIRVHRAEGEIQKSQLALDECYRREGLQFRDERRYLGSKV